MNIQVTSGLPPKNHNNPPVDLNPTPFEMSEVEIGDLYAEAKNWLDGEPVASQAYADALSKLIDDLRKASGLADDRRKTENEPFDAGKAEVQARYAPLIADTKAIKGKAVLAIDMAKKALAPWLQKVEAEKQAAAAKARAEADEKMRLAQEALRASQVADLEKREAAEDMLREAAKSDAAATKAENSKAHATGGTRAMGLRSVWRAEMTDGRAAAGHYWQTRRPEVDAFFQGLADADVRAGKRAIPGFNVIEDRVL
jgi:hypothetical protein